MSIFDKFFKLFKPKEIKDQPIPQVSDGGPIPKSTTHKSVYIPKHIPVQPVPTSIPVRHIVGPNLDTLNRNILAQFTFGRSGAIQIGNYKSGVTGDLRLSPNGITARDSSGSTTFSIDATTGDAYFKGTVAAGSIVTGYIQVGGAASDVNDHGTTIDGGKITANSITASQIASNTITANEIAAGTITANEIAAGTITADEIQVNTITANRLNIAQVSEFTNDLGSITAGDITGVTVTSSSSGDKIVLNNGDYIDFYASGVLKARLRGTTSASGGLRLTQGDFVIPNNKSYLMSETDGVHFGKLAVNSSNQMVIVLPTNSNQFFIKNDSETENLFTVSTGQVYAGKPFSVNGAVTCKELFLNYGQNEGIIHNIDILEGYNDLRLYGNGAIELHTDGTSKVKFYDNADFQDTYNIDAVVTGYAQNWVSTSDKNLKKYIKSINSKSLSILMKLKPKKFKYKKSQLPNDDQRYHYGLIAQDVEKILPELVVKNDNRMYLNYTELIPLIIKSIQELYEEIHSNQARA